MLVTRVKNKEQAAQYLGGIKQIKNKVVSGVKNYGKNVAGGAKIVGGFLDKQFIEPSRRVKKYQGELNKKQWENYEDKMNGRVRFEPTVLKKKILQPIITRRKMLQPRKLGRGRSTSDGTMLG